MPRDRLDGIKTKAGRVVYDREIHTFSLRDIGRICKKFSEQGVEQNQSVNCENISFAGFGLVSAIETLLRIAATAFCEVERYTIITKLKALIPVEKGTESTGGEFGGGGATR